jgi:hypothetical protein
MFGCYDDPITNEHRTINIETDLNVLYYLLDHIESGGEETAAMAIELLSEAFANGVPEEGYSIDIDLSEKDGLCFSEQIFCLSKMEKIRKTKTILSMKNFSRHVSRSETSP